jgi:hypothetical protein
MAGVPDINHNSFQSIEVSTVRDSCLLTFRSASQSAPKVLCGIVSVKY